MPEMILQRNYHMITPRGHAVYFKKGAKTFVPPVVVKDAIAIGAVMVDGEVPNLDDTKPIVTGPADPAERQVAIFKAFDKIVANGVREDFMASGSPNANAVARELGWPIDARERAKAWDVYKTTRGSTED